MVEHFAVIGSGVAGLMAAHVLAGSGTVTLFEADNRPGGHAHTHEVALHDGSTTRVDSGFIVHNDRTYPTLCRLFDELDIPTRPTDMSMSVYSERTRWQYAGGKGIGGILADPRTVARPAFVRMIWEVRRFHSMARDFLDGADVATLTTIGDWLTDRGFSAAFLEHFARPLVAAVWSCSPTDAMSYPARSLLTFLDHHGMLSVSGSPSWRTVVGGSRTYVDRLLANPRIELRCETPVRAVVARKNAVTVRTDHDEHDFAGVVIAAHPRAALDMLKSPTSAQADVLAALHYSPNPAQLHTDSSLLPPFRRARASWNYRLPIDPHEGVLVSYDMTRLMRLPMTDGRRFIVTLGGADRVAPDSVVADMTYEHPLYTATFLRAQARLPEINESRIAFAGAYHGWGFHEDGALSGRRAAEALGGHW